MKLTGSNAMAGAAYPAGVKRLTYTSSVDGLEDWCLLREGDANAHVWIVVIHGHGSAGDQLFTRPDIRQNWLPRFLESGAGLLCPNLRGNAWMGPAAATDTHELIGLLRDQFEMEKTIFCSGSMGGTSNLIFGALHPEDVDGIIARGAASDPASYWRWCRTQDRPVILGIADAIETHYGGTPDAVPQVYEHHSALDHAARLTMPVYLGHGGADTVIPVGQSRRLAAQLRHRDTFVYREIPDGSHDSPLHDTESFPLIWNQVVG